MPTPIHRRREDGKFNCALYRCEIPIDWLVDVDLPTFLDRLYPQGQDDGHVAHGNWHTSTSHVWNTLITNERQTTNDDLRERIAKLLNRQSSNSRLHVSVEMATCAIGRQTQPGSPRRGTKRTTANTPTTRGLAARP